MYLKRIDRFISYFRKQFDLTNDIGDTPIYKIHKKALYLSLIDGLSGVIYPNKSSHRSRFVQTVLDFGEWEQAEYVSLPHLARLLALNPDPEFEALRKHVLSQIDTWSSGDLIYLDKDVKANEVGSQWPKGKEHSEPVNEIRLDSLKHVQLLYTFRNSLIHEFRPLGIDLEVPEDDDPYYLSVYDTKEDKDMKTIHWNLIYPTVFIHNLCKKIIGNLDLYFKENRIDPIEVFSSGKYWLKGLNK